MSHENKTLTPVEQKTVIFYDDEITTTLVEVGGQQVVYIPLRPVVERMGVQWAAQLKRIQRDAILSAEAISVSVMDTQGGQRREMICLPLDMLNGFLFGINAERVRPELRDGVIRYQRECYRILANAFLKREETADLSPVAAVLVQIRETALAVARLADEQLALTTRLDKAAVVVAGHEKRIRVLEQRLDPGNAVTDEQASEIGQKVAALAMFLTEQDNSKNHFQGIFSELHRKFKVTSYKLIPQGKYTAVLDFLDNWYEHAQKGAKK